MAKDNNAVKFDLSKVNMGDIEDFIASMKESKFKDAAAVMAKCCAKCPAEWGAPNEAATFYGRPPVGEWAWKDVVSAMMDEFKTAGE